MRLYAAETARSSLTIMAWIAARAFGIRLEKSASQAAIDGRFGPGPLAGRSVNITWYPSVKVKACSISRSTRNRTGVS
jgi:hypothetical protein